MKISTVAYNLIGIVASLLLLNTGFKQQGYQFVKNMLSSNYEIIKEYKGLSLDDRFAIKMGIGYTAFKYVREQTPDTAVILLPRREDFMPQGKKSQFNGELYNMMWASRFLYPRKVVSRYTIEQDQAHYQPTHVIVVNDSCKEFLEYTIPSYIEFGVFPVQYPK